MSSYINLPIEHRRPILEALREYIQLHKGMTHNELEGCMEAQRFLNQAPVHKVEITKPLPLPILCDHIDEACDC